MKKTSLYIDPEVDRALERRAAAEGITKAELVRRVLAAVVSERTRPRARVLGRVVSSRVRETSVPVRNVISLRRALAKRDRGGHLSGGRLHEPPGQRPRTGGGVDGDGRRRPLHDVLIVTGIDHLVSRAGGSDAALAFYEDLASGAYLVEW